MEPDIYFNIPEHKVAQEIIDGEAIVIHFDTGNYYSLQGISAQLWHSFVCRASRRQILDAFADLTPDQIKSLDNFTASLINEQILEKSAAGPALPAASPLPHRTLSFELPSFSRYNDMQNLLLSDPIHDVDETGWPNLKADKV